MSTESEAREARPILDIWIRADPQDRFSRLISATEKLGTKTATARIPPGATPYQKLKACKDAGYPLDALSSTQVLHFLSDHQAENEEPEADTVKYGDPPPRALTEGGE